MAETQRDNEYYTPKEIWASIAKYLPKNKVGLEPFTAGDKRIGSLSYFKEIGLNVKGGTGDFFDHPLTGIDYVVSNPPYSSEKGASTRDYTQNIKYRIMKRLIDKNIPFMLLVPVITLNTAFSKELFLKNGKADPHLQIIDPLGKIPFYKITEDGKMNFKKQPFTVTAFICWKMNLPKDLILYTIPRINRKVRYVVSKKIKIKKRPLIESLKADLRIPTITITDYDEEQKLKRTTKKK